MAETGKPRDLTVGVPADDFRDHVVVAGRVGDDDVIVTARALATIGRDRQSLEFEAELEGALPPAA